MKLALAQWVITDPAGIRPFAESASEDYAGDISYPDGDGNIDGLGFGVESDIRVIISGIAPNAQPDGSAIELGNLWWSYLTGKMYVYWQDEDGNNQWTVCNPSGSFNSEYSANIFPDGPLGPTDITPTPLGQVFELPEQKRLFFENLNNFFANDRVLFATGLYQEDNNENAYLELMGIEAESVATFVRGYNDEALLLPQGTKLINRSRTLYTVKTAVPHKLNVGDIVEFSGSSIEEVNAKHVVVQAGNVTPAEVVPIINGGKITNLQIVSRGAGYSEDFEITFITDRS